jgi:hypothetical protein
MFFTYCLARAEYGILSLIIPKELDRIPKEQKG